MLVVDFVKSGSVTGYRSCKGEEGAVLTAPWPQADLVQGTQSFPCGELLAGEDDAFMFNCYKRLLHPEMLILFLLA